MTDLIERCADLPRRSFSVGDVVIEQGKAFSSIVILVEGSVSIERDGVTLAMLDTRRVATHSAVASSRSITMWAGIGPG